jgi:hypothetical protein
MINNSGLKQKLTKAKPHSDDQAQKENNEIFTDEICK